MKNLIVIFFICFYSAYTYGQQLKKKFCMPVQDKSNLGCQKCNALNVIIKIYYRDINNTPRKVVELMPNKEKYYTLPNDIKPSTDVYIGNKSYYRRQSYDFLSKSTNECIFLKRMPNNFNPVGDDFDWDNITSNKQDISDTEAQYIENKLSFLIERTGLPNTYKDLIKIHKMQQSELNNCIEYIYIDEEDALVHIELFIGQKLFDKIISPSNEIVLYAILLHEFSHMYHYDRVNGLDIKTQELKADEFAIEYLFKVYESTVAQITDTDLEKIFDLIIDDTNADSMRQDGYPTKAERMKAMKDKLNILKELKSRISIDRKKRFDDWNAILLKSTNKSEKDRAVNSLNDLLENQNPTQVEGYYIKNILANYHYAEKEYSKAKKYFDYLINDFTVLTSSSAYFDISELYFKRGVSKLEIRLDPSSSIQDIYNDFKEAIRRGYPNPHEVYQNINIALGNNFARQRAFFEAERNPFAKEVYGDILLERFDGTDSLQLSALLKYYQIAFDSIPNRRSEIAYKIFSAYIKANNYCKAFDYYQKINQENRLYTSLMKEKLCIEKAIFIEKLEKCPSNQQEIEKICN